MNADVSLSPGSRVLAVALLAVVLAGVLVGAGTIGPDPATNTFPDGADVASDPAAHVSQQVAVGGTVVETDPVVIRVRYGFDEFTHLTLVNVEDPVSEGDSISVFGTLTDEGTIEAERTLVRTPWESWYMYVVSFVGGLLVLGRLVRHWRVDRERVALVPRGEGDG